MLFDEVCGKWTDHIDSQRIIFCILKRSRDEFESNSFPAQTLGHLCMPDRHPAMTVCVKLQIADLPILLNLKPALDYPG